MKIQLELDEVEDHILKIYMGIKNIKSKKQAIKEMILEKKKLLDLRLENG